MRILHINCNYIGTTLHQLMVEHLDALGYSNSVFVPTYDRKIAVIKPNANVCISECFKRWNRLFFDYKQSKIQRSVQKVFDISNFDCIHAYTLFTDGNCAMSLSKKYGKPFVVAVRNTDVNTFFKYMPHLRKRGIEIIKNASRVFFLSEAYRELVFGKYVPDKYRDILWKKTTVIPNGIDDFWFASEPKNLPILPKQIIKLIYAGRIDKNKNIHSIQIAMKMLEDIGYYSKLTVIGRVIDKHVFDAIRKDKRTVYISPEPKEKLIELYRQHNIFVMPSFTESFGLVYAEAMSQGLPVIYTRGQGFDGNFNDGYIGYPVNAKKPEEIAEAIIRIIKDYERISANCLPASKKFMWETIVDEYDRVYRSL